MEKEKQNFVGDLIGEIWKLSGLNADEFSKRILECGKSHLYNLIKGETYPKIEVLKRLTQYLIFNLRKQDPLINLFLSEQMMILRLKEILNDTRESQKEKLNTILLALRHDELTALRDRLNAVINVYAVEKRNLYIKKAIEDMFRQKEFKPEEIKNYEQAIKVELERVLKNL